MQSKEYLKYNNNAYMYVEFPHKKFWNKQINNSASFESFFSESLKELQKDNYLYYVHIPHCHTQCLYCTCHVEITKDYEVVKKYLNLLLKEIDVQLNIFTTANINPIITHLHMGGGSPTFLKPEEYDVLTKKLEKFINFNQLFEYSIEIDPRRIKEDRMYYYHSKGINRISFGVQEFDKEVQKMIARVQPASLTEKLLTKEIRKLFPNGINFDLICGLPGQRLVTFQTTIKKTIELNPDRICLNYMHLSPIYHPHQLKMPKDLIPDENLRKELFLLAEEMLLKNGYLRAGYDHFIKKTDYLAEQIKNKRAGWDRLGIVSGQYNGILGAGVSSVGKLNGKLYYQNTFENIEYERLINLKRLPVANFHFVSKKDQISEYVIKNLRQYFYINKKDVNSKFNLEFDDFFKKPINLLKEFEQDNLLINNENYIKLTKTGEIYSNLIASKFDYYINN
jgi:oxygen-independent coproporphyrinogen-3 oxidase